MAWGLQPAEADPSSGMRRGLGAERLMAYLALFPGDTWQERWQASPLEEAGPGVTKDVVSEKLGLPTTKGPIYLITAGLGALLALDVVRPSFDYLHGLRTSNLWLQLAGFRNDPDADILIAAPASEQSRSHSSGVLGRLLVLTGRPVAKLTAADLLAHRDTVLVRRNQTVGLEHLWACLESRGVVEGTLRQAIRPGQKTVTQLVDNNPIKSSRVRALFIAYLTERAVGIDYSTLRSVVTSLCTLYWTQVEQISPGIDTINLSEDVATAWKEQIRWRELPGGGRVPRRNLMNVLMTVRGFYADLIQLAFDDPARWAGWACPPPISDNEVKRYDKWRNQLRSEMHERTRVRAVKVTTLADVAERRYQEVRALYEAARTVAKGERVTVGGDTYERVDGAAHNLAHPRMKKVQADGSLSTETHDLIHDEEDAFWGVVVVEVLRHTGIRIEEMLELTQLDVHEYDHRDPNVGKVLLLHVNPSKMDQERMLVIAPELAAILASVARRIRSAVGSTEAALPSVVLYDYAECKNSEPLPFFFQRTAGKGFKGTTRPITKAYVSRVLRGVCAAAGSWARMAALSISPPMTSGGCSPPTPWRRACRPTSSKSSSATPRSRPPRATPPSSPRT